MAVDDKYWCLCRWMSAWTSLILYARGELSDNEKRVTCRERGINMCGPLSPLSLDHFPDIGTMIHLGALGFPHGNIARIATWDHEEDALAVAKSGEAGSQDWTSIDKPTPVEALIFYVRKYNHHNGVATLILSKGEYHLAVREWALAKMDAKPFIDVTLHAVPNWDRIEPYLPTPEESAHMWDVEAFIDNGGGGGHRVYRSREEGRMLKSVRDGMGVPRFKIRWKRKAG